MKKVQPAEILGRVYNNLTVLSLDHTDEHGRDWYLCKCRCERTTVARGVEIRKGNIRSCGCNTGYPDMSGKKFGYLTLTYRLNERTDRYTAQCICGSEFQVLAARLREGYIRSCGCRRGTSSDNRDLDNRLISFENYKGVIQKILTGTLFKAFRTAANEKLQLVNIKGIKPEAYASFELGEILPSKDEEMKVLNYFGVSQEDFDANMDHYTPQIVSRAEAIGMDAAMTMDELVKRIIFNILTGNKFI